MEMFPRNRMPEHESGGTDQWDAIESQIMGQIGGSLKRIIGTFPPDVQEAAEREIALEGALTRLDRGDCGQTPDDAQVLGVTDEEFERVARSSRSV